MDTRFDLRKLRRRMGWTSTDLARHLGVGISDLEIWEKDQKTQPDLTSRIEFLFRQAEMCSDEVKRVPQAEHLLDETALDQVNGDRVKDRELR